MEQNLGIVVDRDRMAKLEQLTRDFPADHYKLMAVLKSQLLSGNKPGAKKMIQAYIPDVRLAWWVQLVLWPFVAVVRIIGGIVNVLRPVGRLGKL